ncbi:pentapeptide repeat-containing protein [Thalassospira tepidiphila]|uniref:pentapeptide repeat-containing protein n=1 Tax=Thalassospira tepidiphila TaxID=393657 RepID=UPI003AA7C58E
MMSEDETKTPKLEGEEAVALWRKGRIAWNNWIANHSNTEISFANVNFSSERHSKAVLSFEGYNFGNRTVSFSNANFGCGSVYFTGAVFGDGGVDFSEANFQEGIVSFFRATFGDGDINFDYANFNGDGLALIEFSLGKGNINLNYTRATYIIVKPDRIADGRIEGQGLKASNNAIFDLESPNIKLRRFDLLGASFEGALLIKGDLAIVPDLRAARSSHQIELSGLNIELRRVQASRFRLGRFTFSAEDPEDSARLRRLKEIAEINKDHKAALRFSAEENRASRWITTSKLGSLLDIAFSGFSDYGQSIIRPITHLIFIFLMSVQVYRTLAIPMDQKIITFENAVSLSLGNSLPFLPQARALRDDAIKVLYSNDPSLLIDAIMIGQGTLSFIFLFLIGLGLRNRFRL